MSAPVIGSATPWGRAQHASTLAPGIVSVSTAGHGGVWLSPERLASLPESVRTRRDYAPREQGWFEEDCAACVPLLAFFEEIAKTQAHVTPGLIPGLVSILESVYPEDLAALRAAGLVRS